MPPKKIPISMTSFADFAVCDSMGQLAKVREIYKRYQQEYMPGRDFWSRFLEGLSDVLRAGGNRNDLDRIHASASHNRTSQYASACRGFRKFWGRHKLELAGDPTRSTWDHGRLRVRVNPEWILKIDDESLTVKLHLKKGLEFNQRLANPLLHMMSQKLGPPAGGPPVAILDVHRGKLWRPTQARRNLEPVLHMQAAAFITGWDVVATEEQDI